MSQTFSFNKAQKIFLQNIPLTSIKGLDSLFPILQKENIYHEEVYQKNRKNSYQIDQSNLVIPPLKLRDSCRWQNLKPAQETVTPAKKSIRPWAAKPTRPSHQSKCIDRDSTFQKSSSVHKRKSGRADSRNNDINNYNSEQNSKEMPFDFARQSRAGSISERQGTIFNGRDRANSCRVAVKKGVFPINRKQYEQIKLFQHFQREEERLSTIPGSSQKGSQKFISMDSYTQLIF